MASPDKDKFQKEMKDIIGEKIDNRKHDDYTEAAL